MAHFKRHKPKRQVTCFMCQWAKVMGNGRERRRFSDRRRIAAAEATKG